MLHGLVTLQQKKPKHKPSTTPTPDSSTEKPVKKSKAKSKAKASEDVADEDGKGKGKAKKPRKKKDKNEPKRGLSAFMFFSQANREKVCSHDLTSDLLLRRTSWCQTALACTCAVTVQF